MSSFATVLTRLGLDEHSPLLASDIAQDLVDGKRTISIHDYALPDWCKDVDIAVVEKKGDDAVDGGDTSAGRRPPKKQRKRRPTAILASAILKELEARASEEKGNSRG